MAKKNKTDLDIHNKKIGKQRRQELLEKITKNDTFLPESILHEDMDMGMLEFVQNKLKVISDGNPIPVNKQIFSLQRWAEFSQTWYVSDSDKNVELPFILVVRQPDPQPGSHPSVQYTIPERRTFTFATVKTWNGSEEGGLIYKIPQPVPIDIEYEVIMICERMRDLNRFNKIVLQTFSSRQAYTTIKGHYIPIILESISDESTTSIEEKRFFQQVYKLRLVGFLIDEEEFEVFPAVNRTIIFTELEKTKTKKQTRIVGDVEIEKMNFIANGSTTTFNVGEKMGALLAVSVNGVTATRDVDFYFNENTSHISFVSPPTNGKSITVLYISTRTVKLYSGSQEIYLRTKTVSSDEGTVFHLPESTGVLYYSVEGTLHFETDFTFSGGTVTIPQYPSGQQIVFYYI